MKYKENELYREIEIFLGDTKVGEAEIDINNKMLWMPLPRAYKEEKRG